MSAAAGGQNNNDDDDDEDEVIINDDANSSTDNAVIPTKLKSIWDCNRMNKGLVPGADGIPVAGWTCGWCPGGGRSFKGENATKALAHVAKIKGKNIISCTGNIPRHKIIQYRDLWLERSSTKSEKNARSAVLDNSISDMQIRAVNSMFGATIDSGTGEGGDDCVLVNPAPARKRAHEVLVLPGGGVSGGSGGGDGSAASTITSSTHSTKMTRVSGKQLKLCGNANAVNPDAPDLMNIAIADFIHSNLLPFSLAEDPKFLRVLQVAKSLGAYKPPNQMLIGSKYLDALHAINWKEQMKTLLSEATIFGITIFGDGATIKSIPLLNVLAAGVNNPFALLNIADCTGHLAEGGKKDASHIATIIKPLIANLEGEVDEHDRKCTGIVDLVFFDGASNVQNAGELLRVKYPRITVGHGAEHVVSLFFKDVYDKVTDIHDVYVSFYLGIEN